MSFVSFTFLILLVGVFLARLTVGRSHHETPFLALLLLASLTFYGWHVPTYLLLLLASVVVDYFAGRRIADLEAGDPHRRWLLILSLVTNLGMLGYFKYTGFALGSVRTALVSLGLESSFLPHWEVVLPIGISFYTFQSMSYTIDIYRGELAPIRTFWRFLLFVSFFPQLVAGPIVRAGEFFYQLERRRSPSLTVFGQGSYLIIRGLFLKMVLADNLGPVVDRAWPSLGIESTSSVEVLLVTILFSCQILCDFAGYSSIARGVAYLLGFRLPINFDSPYVAASFKEFWTRWHITLSRWLRDYLYIPLGGNRLSPWRTYANLLLVMLLGGLWHGAAMTFVVWGALHGLALAVERLLGIESRRTPVVTVFWYGIVQLTVLVTWIFFRSSNLGAAVAIVSNLFAFRGGLENPEPLIGLLFVLPVALMHLKTVAVERFGWPPGDYRDQAIQAGGMLYLITTCYGTSDEFIYFQF